jgi:hypothetical protein
MNMSKSGAIPPIAPRVAATFNLSLFAKAQDKLAPNKPCVHGSIIFLKDFI